MAGAKTPIGAGGAGGAVRYLDYSMHSFRRCSWVSDAARSLWEERIHRIEKSLQPSPSWASPTVCDPAR